MPSAAIARMLDPTEQNALMRRCKFEASAAIVPLLLIVPPAAPHPDSKTLCTAAGELRVPPPSAKPLVSALPFMPASFRLMMVASATVMVGLPVMLSPQLGQLMEASTIGASTALMPLLATSGAPVRPSA